MALPGNDAVLRFQENEVRFDDFLNINGVYLDKNGNPIETLPSLVNTIATMTLRPNFVGNWATDTIYNRNDVVKQNGINYICNTANTSGTFATDLAAGKWFVYQSALSRDLGWTSIFKYMTDSEITGVITGTSTNNQSAIDAAYADLPSYGTLYFPAGLYRGNLKLRKSNICIRGAGSGCTTIKLIDGAQHTLTIDAGPGTATGTPCVIDVGYIGAGNYATEFTHIDIHGLTVDGNQANVPTITLDLFGWGISYTKASNCRYSDIRAINCKAGGIGIFINSNFVSGDASIEMCGQSAMDHPGFDINSSKWGIHDVIISGGPYGIRCIDNCWGNQIRGVVNSPGIIGFVHGNQSVNESYNNIFDITVNTPIGGGAQIGLRSTGNIGRFTINGAGGYAFQTALAVAWITAHAYAVGNAVSINGENYLCATAHTSGTFATDLAAVKWTLVQQGGNDYTVSSRNGQTSSCLIGTAGDNYTINSYLDGRGGGAGSNYAVDITGNRNVINAIVTDSATPHVRGVAFRAGATANRLMSSATNGNVQALSDSGSGTFIGNDEGTWTPTASALTGTGITYTGKWIRTGNKIDFTVSISGTGLASSAGSTYLTTPFAPARMSTCTAYSNGATWSGTGVVNASTGYVFLPAFASSTSMAVSGTAFLT